jgi:hypothetical protein
MALELEWLLLAVEKLSMHAEQEAEKSFLLSFLTVKALNLNFTSFS